ncbi:MAG: hypothetical protein II842_00655 [Butyrivibrio sp.]|nr:hypothetical protein [Butyrivibrio sp.]
MKENPVIITSEEMKNATVLLSSCCDCGKTVRAEYYNENFQTRRTKFLGREGTETTHYCPYCGKSSPGFLPDDPSAPWSFDDEDEDADVDAGKHIDAGIDEDFKEESEGSWWPDADGVILGDDEDDEEDFSFGPNDENAVAFLCPSCNEKFRINPRGYKKIHCLYCGKIIDR